MTEARRTVCGWLLTVLLERGLDPVAERRRQGDLARAELVVAGLDFGGRPDPLGNVRFFPLPRPRPAS